MHGKSISRKISAPRPSIVPQLAPRAPQKVKSRLQGHMSNQTKVNSFRKRLYKQSQFEQQCTSSKAKVRTSSSLTPLESRPKQLQKRIQPVGLKVDASPIIEETVIPLQKPLWSNTSRGNMNKMKEKYLIKTQDKKIPEGNHQSGHLQQEPGKEQRFIVTVRGGKVVKIDPYLASDEADVSQKTKRQHFGKVPKTIQSVINQQFFQSLSEEANGTSSLDDGSISPTQEGKSWLDVPRDRRAAVTGTLSPFFSESGSDSSSPTRRQGLCTSTDKFEADRRFLRMLHKKF